MTSASVRSTATRPAIRTRSNRSCGSGRQWGEPQRLRGHGEGMSEQLAVSSWQIAGRYGGGGEGVCVLSADEARQSLAEARRTRREIPCRKSPPFWLRSVSCESAEGFYSFCSGFHIVCGGKVLMNHEGAVFKERRGLKGHLVFRINRGFDILTKNQKYD